MFGQFVGRLLRQHAQDPPSASSSRTDSDGELGVRTTVPRYRHVNVLGLVRHGVQVHGVFPDHRAEVGGFVLDVH